MPKEKSFNVGDRVAYSANWLRSTGNYTGDLPRLRGTVRETQKFDDNQLCVIEWDNYKIKSEYHDDGFGRVIAFNLTLVKHIAFDAA